MNKIIILNGINKTRLENELILYDKDYERNSYGYEILVNNKGIVTKKAVNVDFKKDQFILSGHGKMANFLIQNVFIGSFIEIDFENKKVLIEDNPFKRNKYLVKDYLNKITKKLLKCEKELLDVDFIKAKKEIENIKKIVNTINETNHQQLVLKSLNSYEKAYQYLTVSNLIEARGVWHRPKEKSLKEIEILLDTLLDLNINELYVETLWNGFSIYPSKYFPYHPTLDNEYGIYGKDYLKALLSEASKRHINIHAWCENFFVGIISGLHSHLWEDNPSWQIVNYNNSPYQTGKYGNEEEGFLFFNPANKEVQDLIINFYKELLENYQIRGVQLDYIRYPAGNIDYNFSSGYNLETVSEFQKKEGITSDIRKFVLEENNYNKWNGFRSNIITKFVKRVYDEVMINHSDVLLSIAVGPNANYAKKNLMQDWESWVKDGYIDIICPMAYVRSEEQIKEIVNKMNDISLKKTFNYTGIAPTFDKLDDMYNVYFIDESRKNNALGNVIFAYHSLEKKKLARDVLKRSTHRKRSFIPHDDLDNLVIEVDKYIKKQATLKYLPLNLISKENLNILSDSLLSLNKVNNYKDKIKDLKKLLIKLKELVLNEVYYLIKELLNTLLEVIIIKNERLAMKEKLNENKY